VLIHLQGTQQESQSNQHERAHQAKIQIKLVKLQTLRT
jgi:hypothetical protein